MTPSCWSRWACSGGTLCTFDATHISDQVQLRSHIVPSLRSDCCCVQTVGSLLRGNALRQGAKSVSFGKRDEAEKVAA